VNFTDGELARNFVISQFSLKTLRKITPISLQKPIAYTHLVLAHPFPISAARFEKSHENHFGLRVANWRYELQKAAAAWRRGPTPWRDLRAKDAEGVGEPTRRGEGKAALTSAITCVLFFQNWVHEGQERGGVPLPGRLRSHWGPWPGEEKRK